MRYLTSYQRQNSWPKSHIRCITAIRCATHTRGKIPTIPKIEVHGAFKWPTCLANKARSDLAIVSNIRLVPYPLYNEILRDGLKLTLFKAK